VGQCQWHDASGDKAVTGRDEANTRLLATGSESNLSPNPAVEKGNSEKLRISTTTGTTARLGRMDGGYI